MSRARLRDLGLEVGTLPPGPFNAITDVAGVKVGYATVIQDRPRIARTGVTAIWPRGQEIWTDYVFAGTFSFNGNGEMTGLPWLAEQGLLGAPIGITNTYQVGIVRDAITAMAVRDGASQAFHLPVVAETYDGWLSDIQGFTLTQEHAFAAFDSAVGGCAIAEGNVGGGTGMICHGFKGGIGTASRVTETAAGPYTVGVLVQANHGRRERLRVNGIPIGELIGADTVPLPEAPKRYEQGSGSIIVIVATDAPLLPHQCMRLAQRSALAVSRLGGSGEQYSGDLMLAFSTGNRGIPPYAWDEDTDTVRPEVPLRMVAPQLMTRLFDLTIEATEEAIVNALVAATTLTGHNGVTAHALDHDLFQDLFRQDLFHQHQEIR